MIQLKKSWTCDYFFTFMKKVMAFFTINENWYIIRCVELMLMINVYGDLTNNGILYGEFI